VVPDYDQFGYITSDYVIMLLLLIGALAVIYDHYAIYRSNVGLSVKAFRLFKAWSATFCFLVVIAFLTKQSETYSRLLVVQLFIIGYIVQLFCTWPCASCRSASPPMRGWTMP
jgi:hypothetical protein